MKDDNLRGSMRVLVTPWFFVHIKHICIFFFYVICIHIYVIYIYIYIHIYVYPLRDYTRPSFHSLLRTSPSFCDGGAEHRGGHRGPEHR